MVGDPEEIFRLLYYKNDDPPISCSFRVHYLILCNPAFFFERYFRRTKMDRSGRALHVDDIEEDSEATTFEVVMAEKKAPESSGSSGTNNDADPDPGQIHDTTTATRPDVDDVVEGVEDSKGDVSTSSQKADKNDTRGCCQTLSKYVLAVVRDSCMAIFGHELHATDAYNDVVKRKWAVAIFLLVATLVKVLDTVSDVLVTVNWWRNDGQVNSRRSYAQFSVAILAVSAGVSLMFSVANVGQLESWGSWIFVILFSLLDLNVVPWAALLWLDVWTGQKPPEDVFSTKDMEIKFNVRNPKVIWKLMKALEFILEAVPELTLQSYAAAFEFFDDDKTPSVLLQLSITVSVLSIAAGVSTTYLWCETLKVQIWGAYFFAGTLIARIAICTFAFVEFGRFAMIFVAIVVVLRLGILGHMSRWRVIPDDGKKWRCSAKALLFPIVLLLTLPSLVIEMIVPLGLRNTSNDAENTFFWGSFDRSKGIGNAFNIAFFGEKEDTQGVRSRLESPLAKIMIALHVIENLIMLVIIVAEPHREQRAQVGAVPLVAFVVVPMLVEAAAYYMLHRTTKDLETKWTKALLALVDRLKSGKPVRTAEFKDAETVLAGLFGKGITPTVAQCEELIRRIQKGTLDDPDKRRALDLLLREAHTPWRGGSPRRSRPQLVRVAPNNHS